MITLADTFNVECPKCRALPGRFCPIRSTTNDDPAGTWSHDERWTAAQAKAASNDAALLALARDVPPLALAEMVRAYKTPRRPVVLLDVDGVLANFIEVNLATLRGIGVEREHDDVTAWDMAECLDLSASQRAQMKARWSLPGFCASIPEYPGARAGVDSLREIAEVYACTSPMESNPTWWYERTHWLVDRMGIRKHDIVQTAAKHLVRGDVLVEDKPSTLAKWMAAHPTGRGVLWSRAYNAAEAPDGAAVASSWPEVRAIVETLAAELVLRARGVGE